MAANVVHLPSNEPLRQKRLWFGRIHASTLVFGALLLGVLTLANIPGQLVTEPDIFADGKYGPHFYLTDHCEHGWPFTYLKRDWIQLDEEPYWRLSIWNLAEGGQRFRVWHLILNGGVAFFSIVVAGTLFELWRRRRTSLFRFYLFDLALAITVIAIIFGWLAAQHAEYLRETEALSRLQKIADKGQTWRGNVEQRVVRQQGGPTWLRRLIGDRNLPFFDRVVGIELDGPEIEAAAQLKSLKAVSILGGVTDDQLKLLERLPQLEALDMCFGRVDTEGRYDANGNYISPSFQLPRLSRLRGLNLWEAEFSGAGLENLDAIEFLELTDTDVNDDALAGMRGLTTLKNLRLNSTDVTGLGLRHLNSLFQLEALDLGHTEVDDEGIIHLKELRNLRFLALHNTNVSDAAIPTLKLLANLEYLSLPEANVTQQGYDELRRALPNCEIP